MLLPDTVNRERCIPVDPNQSKPLVIIIKGRISDANEGGNFRFSPETRRLQNTLKNE
jgi:hypothetical protein